MFGFNFGFKKRKINGVVSAPETVDKPATLPEHLDIYELISHIKKGFDPNYVDEKGNTFLHRFYDIEPLLEAGVSPDNANKENKEGYIPAAWLMEYGYGASKELIKLTSKENLNRVGPTDETIPTLYLKSGGHHFFRNDAEDIFETLLESGADLNIPNAEGQTPLMLLPNVKSTFLFDYALTAGKYGYDLSVLKRGNVGFLEYLISEAKTEREVAKLAEILELSDVSKTDEHGNTLLHVWAKNFDVRVSCSLEKRRAVLDALVKKLDINAQNDEGLTALMAAFRRGTIYYTYMCHGEPHEDSANRFIDITSLLYKKPDVQIVDNNGNTALHYAGKYGIYEAIPQLIAAGVDAGAMNKDHKKAYDLTDSPLARSYLRLVEYMQKLEPEVPVKVTSSLAKQPNENVRTHE